MRIMTCNIRCFGGNDGDNNWVYRKDFCTDVIRSRNPDLIGCQEVWAEQFADLKAAFPEFDSYGLMDEPQTLRPMNVVFYRRETFDLICAGGYWLSETPHVTGSQSWDSACVRLANWLRLVDRASGKEFRIINTHLDHRGQTAREKQALLICEDAASYPEDYPQILTGDLNCDCQNPAIGVLKRNDWIDTFSTVHGTEDPGFTYHAFQGPAFDAGQSRCGKMDWVFVQGHVVVKGAEVVMDERNGHFPSDHYFVTAEIEL